MAAALPELQRTAWIEIDGDALVANLEILRELGGDAAHAGRQGRRVRPRDGPGRPDPRRGRGSRRCASPRSTRRSSCATRGSRCRFWCCTRFQWPALARPSRAACGSPPGPARCSASSWRPRPPRARPTGSRSSSRWRRGWAAAACRPRESSRPPGRSWARERGSAASGRTSRRPRQRTSRTPRSAASRKPSIASGPPAIEVPRRHLAASAAILLGDGAPLRRRPAGPGDLRPHSRRARDRRTSASTTCRRPPPDSGRSCRSTPGRSGSRTCRRATASRTGPPGGPARPSRIATLPIGYGDGWSRSLSNNGEALVRGLRVPIVGQRGDGRHDDRRDRRAGPARSTSRTRWS